MSVPTEDDLPDMTKTLDEVEGGAEGRLADKGIVPVDGADFIAQELPPPKWIVRDFIAQGMKGDLCGSSKTYKTYVGLQLALCVATGRTFLSAYRVDEPHVVAYANLELFGWNFQERMRAQMSAPDVDEDGKPNGGLGIAPEELCGRFVVYNLRGNPASLRDKVDDLVGQLERLKVELVVIDPRYKLLMPGEDENTGDGLRGILELRDRLAERFAVILVTHDPKGDTAAKKTTDRGAGSYTAGADFDFRLTIDRANGWTHDHLVYVVESEGRARKTPPPVGIRFDCSAQTFLADADVAPVKLDNRLGTKRNSEDRASSESAMQKAYREAALKVVGDAGDNLLDCATFDDRVATMPGASLAVNRRGKARSSLVAQGVLAICRELERKADGAVGNKKNGKTFIATPERIAAYRRKWESLPL